MCIRASASLYQHRVPDIKLVGKIRYLATSLRPFVVGNSTDWFFEGIYSSSLSLRLILVLHVNVVHYDDHRHARDEHTYEAQLLSHKI